MHARGDGSGAVAMPDARHDPPRTPPAEDLLTTELGHSTSASQGQRLAHCEVRTALECETLCSAAVRCALLVLSRHVVT